MVRVFTLVPPTSTPFTVQVCPAVSPVTLHATVTLPPEVTCVGVAVMVCVSGSEQVFASPAIVTGEQVNGPADCVPLVADTVGA